MILSHYPVYSSPPTNSASNARPNCCNHVFNCCSGYSPGSDPPVAPPRPPRRFGSSKVEEASLDKAPKRDPELYVLLGVMSGAFLIAGWYFGRKPTSVNSESNVRIGESAMPWQGQSEDGKVYKYQYHPHGDKSQPLRAAPSAMNTVIVPNVTLPEDLHERFNKYGKEEWDY
ncbi:hypothetical protein N7517_004219 [Penicillium concentricum]|uniref:Uncharacterized protein n=1 Tax=Penicillium concentricum TaxID=293559 RepID=A0A9W9S541_9EURO|nr:uncharacterized protein N7517_004219 [Penicillium concentricum]KAJ5372213.1 hypothetical protein N7517_004219 [Penicillium concentricum]